MKTNTLLATLVAVVIGNSSFAQGSLTPPGAPAPTMKTLAQIEPRTPIAANTTPGDASDTYVISQPGSYYLTTNIVGVNSNNAIKITANNVTLDLDGFTVQGVSTSTAFLYNMGIYIAGTQTNVTVRNGNIVGWGQGIFSGSPASANLTFENLHFAYCYLGPSFAASGMDILGAATVHNCSFDGCFYGIGLNNNNTTSPSTVTGCTANNNSDGIACGGSGVISDCTANNNSVVGINLLGGHAFAVSGCTLSDNYYGIYVNPASANNRIEGNHVVVGSGVFGILAGSTNNIVIKNSVEGGGANNYGYGGTDIVGPIITAPGIITNSNPWANFSF